MNPDLYQELVKQINNLQKQIDGLIKPEVGRWIDWTPTVTQLGAVAVTINSARYKASENLVFVDIFLTVTGAGTGGNAIIIGGQPTAIQATTNDVIGLGAVTDVGVNTYPGAIYVAGATDWRFISTSAVNYIGINPNFGLAATGTIRFKCAFYKA